MDTVNGVEETVHVRVPSREELVELNRQSQEDGFLFPLTVPTGFKARFKLLTLSDKAFLNALPDAAQRMVMETIGLMSGQQAVDDKLPMHKRALRNLGQSDQVAQLLMAHTWISPRIVITLDQIPRVQAQTDGPVWLASDVHAGDRIRFLGLMTGQDPEVVSKLEPFRPGTAPVVSAEPDVETAAAGVGDPEPVGIWMDDSPSA